MSKKSPIASLVATIKKFPKPYKNLRRLMLLEELKFVGTAKLTSRDVATKGSCEISNRKIVQNHIGGVCCCNGLTCRNGDRFCGSMSIPVIDCLFLKVWKLIM